MTTNSAAENHRPTIYIDADGCPVVDITIRVARAKHLSCIILCDTSHVFEKEGAKTITVSKGADSVDFALVNLVQPHDIVITQDYGLAAMCLARRAIPLHQAWFTPATTSMPCCTNATPQRSYTCPAGERKASRNAPLRRMLHSKQHCIHCSNAPRAIPSRISLPYTHHPYLHMNAEIWVFHLQTP